MKIFRGCSFLLFGSVVTSMSTAFDTGHHSDLTKDALLDFGMSEKSIQVCQVENWLVDFYFNREAGVDDHIRNDCAKLHADNLFSEVAVANYWKRFSFNAKAGFEEAARNNNPKQVLALLGMSLHAVQDFYSHSNWPDLQKPATGFDYSTTTFFDAATITGVRSGKAGSSNDPANHPRHGGYDDGMNHDWYGRPNWDKAYVLAYSGSRQWINQARIWVSAINPSVWVKACNISLTPGQSSRLNSDLHAAYRISEWVKYETDDGHWKGKGSGDRTSFVAFTAAWIVGTLDSIFVEDFKNRNWQKLLSGGLRGSLDLNVNAAPAVVPSITRLVMNKRAIIVRTVSIKDKDDQDTYLGDADMFAKITIEGQTFIESVMQDKTSAQPSWTTMKFIPADSIRARIHYELWDEDTSRDDHMDINVRNGVSDLDLMFNVASRRLTGVGINGLFDSPTRLFVTHGNPGAEVKLYVTGKTLSPTPNRSPLQPGVRPVVSSGGGIN